MACPVCWDGPVKKRCLRYILGAAGNAAGASLLGASEASLLDTAGASWLGAAPGAAVHSLCARRRGSLLFLKGFDRLLYDFRRQLSAAWQGLALCCPQAQLVKKHRCPGALPTQRKNAMHTPNLKSPWLPWALTTTADYETNHEPYINDKFVCVRETA